jgi:hypothetical protein
MNKELRTIKKFETYFLSKKKNYNSYFLNHKSNQGFIALTTVLLLLAVTVGIAVSVTYSSIGEAQSGLTLFKGEDNLHFIEGCAEDALLKARSSSTFGDPVGTPVSITRPEGTCSVTVNSKTGVTWTMDVTSSTTTYKRTVRVIFDRNATGLSLTSWKEI